MSDELFEKGIALRREMFGPELAEKQIEMATDFTWPLQDMVTRYCFGDVWHRPHLDRKTRSLLTLAMLTALDKPHEIKRHIQGAISNGVSKEEIREVFMHAMVYCGVPAAVVAFRAATEILEEMGLEQPGSGRAT